MSETTFGIAEIASKAPSHHEIQTFEFMGLKFKTSLQDLHFDKEKGLTYTIGHLLSAISIENTSEYYRYGDKDLMLFNNGQWKQISRESLSMFIKRLIRESVRKMGKVGTCFINDIAIKQIVDSLLGQMEEFPLINTIQTILNDGTYKVITNKKVIKIGMDATITQEMNFGQYYNFISLNDFNITNDDLPLEIMDFFKSITKDNISYINYLQELLGHCMLYGHAQEPYIYMLLGSGKNGKSVFIELLKLLVNHKVASINFSDINPTNAEALECNFINLPSELDGDSPMNESILKQITSGDSIHCNPKYRDPRTIIPIAKQIAAMNKLPLIKDGSDGIWRRIQVLPFNLVITKSMQKDPNYFKHLFNQNIAAIRSWALKGLIRLLKNKGAHTGCDVILQATNKYRIDENIPLQFIDLVRQEFYNMYIKNENSKDKEIRIENILIPFKRTKGDDTNFKTTQDDLYKGYKNWCNEFGYKCANKKNFINKVNDSFLDWLMEEIMDNRKSYAIDIIGLTRDNKPKTPKIIEEIPIVFEDKNQTLMSFENQANYFEALHGEDFLKEG